MKRQTTCLLFFVLISILMAGCLQAYDSSDGHQGAPAPADDSVADAPDAIYKECARQLAAVPFPMELLADRVPPGFQMIPFDPAGAMATVIFFVYECQSVTGAGLEPGLMREFGAAILVDAPALYHNAEADSHIVFLGGFTPREDVVERTRDWGIPLEHGDVELITMLLPGGRTGQASGGNDGFRAEINSVVQGDPSTSPASVSRLYGYDGQSITGIVEVHFTPVSNSLAGVATVVEFPGLVPPIVPLQGLGFHDWGASYDFHIRSIDLDDLMQDNGTLMVSRQG